MKYRSTKCVKTVRIEKSIRKIIVSLSVLLVLSTANAHEITETSAESPVSIGADFVSRYVWRGLNFSQNAPAIQPSIEYSIGGFTAGTWGSYTFGEVTSQELDFYASYTFIDEMFTIGVNDYFFPSEDAYYDFFEYANTRTGHVLEATMRYNGTSSLPLSFMLATNFYGADKQTDESGDAKTHYSTYLELGYSFAVKNIEISTFIGGVTSESKYYQTKKAAITNIGASFSKTVKLTNSYGLRLNTSLILDPNNHEAYLVFGLTI
ncbi:MAG: TorF family putative porin [Bacteroidota bacterium]